MPSPLPNVPPPLPGSIPVYVELLSLLPIRRDRYCNVKRGESTVGVVEVGFLSESPAGEQRNGRYRPGYPSHRYVDPSGHPVFETKPVQHLTSRPLFTQLFFSSAQVLFFGLIEVVIFVERIGLNKVVNLVGKVIPAKFFGKIQSCLRCFPQMPFKSTPVHCWSNEADTGR